MNPFIIVWCGLLILLAGLALSLGIGYIAVGATPAVIRSFEILQILAAIIFLYTFSITFNLSEEDIEEEDDDTLYHTNGSH